MQRSLPFLWLLVIILLTLNLALLAALNRTRLAAVDTLTRVEAMLNRLTNEVIIYNVELNQPVPFNAEVPFDQTLDVPLNTVVPVDQIMTIPLPGGQTSIQVPVKTNVAVNVTLPVHVKKSISLSTTVQLKTTVPVKINLAQTSLAAYLTQARLLVSQLKNRLLLIPTDVAPAPVVLPTSANIPPVGQPAPTAIPINPVNTPPPAPPLPPTATSAPPPPTTAPILTAPPPPTAPGENKPPLATPPPANPPPGSPARDNLPIVTPTPGEDSPTPAPPTPTSAPILTPTPTAASSDNDRAALLAYAQNVSAWGAQITAAGNEFAQALAIYQSGQSTQAEFEAAFRVFEPKTRAAISEINRLSPPPAAAETHQKLINGLGQCDQAMAIMNDWFNTRQSGTKEMTAALVFSCLSQVNIAEEGLKRLVKQ